MFLSAFFKYILVKFTTVSNVNPFFNRYFSHWPRKVFQHIPSTEVNLTIDFCRAGTATTWSKFGRPLQKLETFQLVYGQPNPPHKHTHTHKHRKKCKSGPVEIVSSLCSDALIQISGHCCHIWHFLVCQISGPIQFGVAHPAASP